MASLQDLNRRTVERFLAGTHTPNLDDLDVIDETVAAEIVGHGFPGAKVTDRQSYKAFFRTFRQAFSDMAFQIDQLVADDRHVAVRWTVAATHSGPFAGVAGDGRGIAFNGMALYRMRDGLIAETWLHVDELGLLSAIGAIPAALATAA